MSVFLWVLAVASLGVFFAYLREKARRRTVLRELRKRYGSRVRAADRLRQIIAADRQAVPCGRWVRVIRKPKTGGGLALASTDPAQWRRVSHWLDQVSKPHYCWMVRR